MMLTSVVLLILGAMANRTLVGVDCEVNNNGSDDWHEVDGDPVVWFDVEGGYDTDNEYGHYKMLIGGKYEDAQVDDRVITDLWGYARNDHYEQCPPGYQKICKWDAESATGSDGIRGHWMVTLCAKYETCTVNKKAVTGFIANSGSDEHTPPRIGEYERFLFFDVDDGGAWSAHDNSSGHWNTAFYTKMGVCANYAGPQTGGCSKPNHSFYNGYCAGWANAGYCQHTYVSWMQQYCAATCCAKSG